MNPEAINLARRLSVRNEPDLLQEDMCDENKGEQQFSASYCETLLNKLCANDSLPPECTQFPELVRELKRRNSNRHDQAVAFAGMSPRDMAAAMAAREKGQLNHAQIQRRLTTRGRKY